MNRRQIREHIFKILFRIEFNAPEEMAEQVHLYLDELENPSRVEKIEIFEDAQEVEDTKNLKKDIALIRQRAEAVIEKQPQIDDKISAVSDGWKLDRIGKTELAIMRLAVYELCFDIEIPEKVAINEAVEIAKKYCGDDAKGFINAVLGKLTKKEDK